MLFGLQARSPHLGVLLYGVFMIDVKQIQRWLNVAVRSVRLVFVILVGATLLQAPLDSREPAIGLLVSGAVMLLLDLRVKPHLLSGGIGGRARYQVCGRGVDGCRRAYQAANVLERGSGAWSFGRQYFLMRRQGSDTTSCGHLNPDLTSIKSAEGQYFETAPRRASGLGPVRGRGIHQRLILDVLER